MGISIISSLDNKRRLGCGSPFVRADDQGVSALSLLVVWDVTFFKPVDVALKLGLP